LATARGGCRTAPLLVTHTGNIGSAFGEETVQEGETLVFGPGAKLLGTVKAEEWAELSGG
jgi:hypothetical protein